MDVIIRGRESKELIRKRERNNPIIKRELKPNLSCGRLTLVQTVQNFTFSWSDTNHWIN